MDLEGVTLSEVRQSKTDTVRFHFLRNPQNNVNEQAKQKRTHRFGEQTGDRRPDSGPRGRGGDAHLGRDGTGAGPYAQHGRTGSGGRASAERRAGARGPGAAPSVTQTARRRAAPLRLPPNDSGRQV